MSNFDDISFPLKLAVGSGGGASFKTSVITTDGGAERRNQLWSQARRIYDARSGVRSLVELAVLQAFFQARGGRARAFRLRDPADFSSATDGIAQPLFTDQTLGVGDDMTTVFAITKSYGASGLAHTRRITKPLLDGFKIGVAGNEMPSGWNVDTQGGFVTFDSAPAAGQIITAGFMFDVPVRFDTDEINVTFDTLKLVHTKIPMIEVRV